MGNGPARRALPGLRQGRGRHKGGNDCNETDLICVMGTGAGVTTRQLHFCLAYFRDCLIPSCSLMQHVHIICLSQGASTASVFGLEKLFF